MQLGSRNQRVCNACQRLPSWTPRGPGWNGARRPRQGSLFRSPFSSSGRRSRLAAALRFRRRGSRAVSGFAVRPLPPFSDGDERGLPPAEKSCSASPRVSSGLWSLDWSGRLVSVGRASHGSCARYLLWSTKLRLLFANLL